LNASFSDGGRCSCKQAAGNALEIESQAEVPTLENRSSIMETLKNFDMRYSA
jgi:hypothetical protein